MDSKIFLDNFGHFLDAPNGIQKLRDMILQLAVRGKLVPQYPNDEPASVLLKKIKTEKKRLIKEKKIRKQKPLPLIKEEEIPFQLPDSWRWVKLGEILNYTGAKKVTPSQIKPDSWILELENIEKDTSKILRQLTFKERPSKSNKTAFEKGDVLYGKLRPYLNKVVLALDNGFCTTEIVPLRPYLNDFTSEFLLAILRSSYFRNHVNELSYGVKMPRLGTDDARNTLIPVSPKNEQKRIVAKINELMLFCNQLEEQQKKKIKLNSKLNISTLNKLEKSANDNELSANWQRLKNNFDMLYTVNGSIQQGARKNNIIPLAKQNLDKLRQSILQLAVQGKLTANWRKANSNVEPASVLLEKVTAEKEKLIKEKKIKKQKPLPLVKEDEIPFELPNSWEWVKLGEILNYTGAKKVTPSQIKQNSWILELEDIEKDTSNILRKRIFKERPPKSNKAVFKKGDVLYGKLRPYLNKVVLAPDNGFCTTEIVPLRPYLNDFTSEFLLTILRSSYFMNHVNELSYGVKMPRLGTDDARNTLIPISPTNEQKQIVVKVDELMALCDQLEKDLTSNHEKSTKLVNSILNQLNI